MKMDCEEISSFINYYYRQNHSKIFIPKTSYSSRLNKSLGARKYYNTRAHKYLFIHAVCGHSVCGEIYRNVRYYKFILFSTYLSRTFQRYKRYGRLLILAKKLTIIVYFCYNDLVFFLISSNNNSTMNDTFYVLFQFLQYVE